MTKTHQDGYLSEGLLGREVLFALVLASGEVYWHDLIRDLELLQSGNNDLRAGREDCAVNFENHNDSKLSFLDECRCSTEVVKEDESYGISWK